MLVTSEGLLNSKLNNSAEGPRLLLVTTWFSNLTIAAC